MKNIFLFCMFALSFAAHAIEEDGHYKINLDWNKKATLREVVVQQCDDTYYSAVEIIIPGKAKKDFSIEMNADISSGKAILGCTFTKKEEASTTTFTFDADSSCEIRVYKIRANFREEPKSAHYEIGDAC